MRRGRWGDPSRIPHSLFGQFAVFGIFVVAESDEHRVPQQPLLRPLLVPHFCDELGPDPGVVLPRRHGTVRRWLGDPQRLELGGDVLQLLRREAAPRAARVHQSPALTAVVGCEMQRAEPAARALRRRIANDDELAGLVGFDLEPVGRAPRAVGRVRLLGHDPLEPHLHHALVQLLALGLEVLEELERTGARQQALQDLFASHQRQPAQVEALERREVEGVEDRGGRHRGAADVERPGLFGAVLEALEAGPPGLVGDDQLAVEDHVVERQRRDRPRDLREQRGQVVAVARQDPRLAVLAGGAHAVTVELQLKHPTGFRERLLARLGEHRGDVLGGHCPLRRLEFLQLLADRRRAVLPLLQLLNRPAREHRVFGEHVAVGRDVRVPFLNEQPLLLALLDFHEGPAALELVAIEIEEQLPLDEPGERILHRRPGAAVPDDDRSRAVVAFGDDPLEVAVFEWVVLDVHGEAFVGGVARRALGHRPRAQHPLHLEPQVPVQPPCGVLVDDEQAARRSRRQREPRRLRRALDGTFGAVSA